MTKIQRIALKAIAKLADRSLTVSRDSNTYKEAYDESGKIQERFFPRK